MLGKTISNNISQEMFFIDRFEKEFHFLSDDLQALKTNRSVWNELSKAPDYEHFKNEAIKKILTQCEENLTKIKHEYPEALKRRDECINKKIKQLSYEKKTKFDKELEEVLIIESCSTEVKELESRQQNLENKLDSLKFYFGWKYAI